MSQKKTHQMFKPFTKNPPFLMPPGKTSRHTCRRQGLAVMVLVGYVLLVALGGLVAGLECKNGALEMIGG